MGELHNIKQPTLIVSGIRDAMVPTPDSFLMAQKIPNAQLVIYPDSGHGSLFQYPEAFSRAVLDFIATPGERRPSLTATDPLAASVGTRVACFAARAVPRRRRLGRARVGRDHHSPVPWLLLTE
ncbi:alpha/beta hydrolase [Nonomuraea angiospora]|uniref:alpha/beta fold hydrolase n=1 Tax=Nonomuraea angiospora TaxID=46172 RepID=UPI003328F1B7